jgi:hypothetical protein
VLDQTQYVSEKLRQLESERTLPFATIPGTDAKPPLASLLRPLGRVLHRTGHRLESWGASGGEQEILRLRRKTG